MGIVKQYMMDELDRGYDRTDGYICAECVSDDWLQNWIECNAASNACSFCGNENCQGGAASFERFIGVVMTGIRLFWSHPDEEGVSYISAEGGYQYPISDNNEVLYDLGISTDWKVIEALSTQIHDNGWVEKGLYAGNEGNWLRDGWEGFKEFVKKEEINNSCLSGVPEYSFGPEIAPQDMLREISRVFEKNLQYSEMIRTISGDEDIFRVRLSSKEYFSSAAELGSPPVQFATQPNRMTPAGVSMFYGAFDIRTALSETFDPEISEDVLVSIGRFNPVRPLLVLDLTNTPNIPSVFDEESNFLFHSLKFIEEFSHDIAIPIKRDGRESIEYRPTQLVTKHFRQELQVNGKGIDGIVYRSSKCEGHAAFVLFCDNDQCIDMGTGGDGMLKLIDYEHGTAKNYLSLCAS